MSGVPNGKRIVCVARVLKKYTFSKHLLFFDIIACDTPRCTTIFSVVFKSSEGCELAVEYPSLLDVRAGDIVSVNGLLERDATSDKQEKYANLELWNVSTVLISTAVVGTIEKLFDWPTKEYGVFFVDEKKYLTPSAPTMSCIDGRFPAPTLIIQVKDKSTEKTIELLRASYPSVTFRESTTLLSKSKDRQILAFDSSTTENNTPGALDLTQLMADSILSQAMTRVYAIDYHSRPFIMHPHLDLAINQFRQTVLDMTNNGKDGVRIQASPRSVASYVFDAFDRKEDKRADNTEATSTIVNFSPTDYTQILSVVYADGIWMLSLVHKTDLPIADVYQNSNQFGQKNTSDISAEQSTPVTTSTNRVCKSANKLHEILTRNGWVYDSSTTTTSTDDAPSLGTLHPYGLCLDVGASPGGWTTYLEHTLDSQRVISVDKGELRIVPLPSKVDHWQVLGQQAVDTLRDMKAASESNPTECTFTPVDLYCCDANIPPAVSTEILVSCVRYGLLSETARFVLTLKNSLAKKAEWENAKRDSLAALSALFDDVRLVSLLANTPKECTVTGIMKKKAT